MPIELNVHHGGTLRKDPNVEYVRGLSIAYPPIESDVFRNLYVGWFMRLGEELGLATDEDFGIYKNVEAIWYMIPGRNDKDGMRKLKCDDDIGEMAEHGDKAGKLDVFVEHRWEECDEEEKNKVTQSSSTNTELNMFVPNPPPLLAISVLDQAATQTLVPTAFNPLEPTKKLTARKTVRVRNWNHHTSPSTSPPENLQQIQPVSKPQDNVEWDGVDDRPDSPLKWAELVDVELLNDDESEYEPSEGLESDGEKKFVEEEGEIGERGVEISPEEVRQGFKEIVVCSDSDTDDEESRAFRGKLKGWDIDYLSQADTILNDVREEREIERFKDNLIEEEENEGFFKEERKEYEEVPRGEHIDKFHIDNKIRRDVNDFVSDYDDSDKEIDTPGDSEEEDDRVERKRRRETSTIVGPHTNFSKFQWKAGLRFPNRHEFRHAVTQYAILQGRSLRYYCSDKNRNLRLGVKCVNGCPFKIYASWDIRRATFVVKKLIGKHSCTRDMMSNTQLKSRTIADMFIEVFKVRPHWPEAVRIKCRVVIKRGVAYKAKFIAHRKLHGTMREHYNKLGSYREALKESNPTSSFEIVTDPEIPRVPPVFQRMFVCFDGLRTGFLKGCRPVLCLDGCFLKTFLGGMLLSAIGRDANNQMYPLAWAVVEGENNDSWEWFLNQLHICLEGNDGKGMTLISDQQKGLINAVAKVFPKAEHRNCARHIYQKWQKVHKGDELKMLFWRAVRAYNEVEYNEALEEMKEVSPAAFDAFVAQNPKVFCKAFINTQIKCDVVVSNMAETFNGYILMARTKHIINMLEEIRCALMERLVLKREAMEKWDCEICPRIVEKLEKEKEDASQFHVLPSSYMIFQIDEMKVDIQAKTCTCRKWDVIGIPCSHGVAAIFFLNHKAEAYVDNCYKRDTYLRGYSGSITPCVGERFWPKIDFPLAPPPVKIGPGRPNKNRKKDPFEYPKKAGKLSRHGLQLSCTVCKSKTHTKRKCEFRDQVQEPQPKRTRGRPRKGGQQPPTGTEHHFTVAQPAGRASGRGGGTRRGGRGGSGRRGGGRRGGNGPVGYGVYQKDGNSFVNGKMLLSAPPLSSQTSTSITQTAAISSQSSLAAP